MATSGLNIGEFTEGQDNPDTTINNALNILDGACVVPLVHDVGVESPVDADYTLATTGDYPREYQHFIIQITDTGTLLSAVSPAKSIIVPSSYTRAYLFINSTAQELTFKATTGTGIIVAATRWALLYYDGSNMTRLTSDATIT